MVKRDYAKAAGGGSLTAEPTTDMPQVAENLRNLLRRMAERVGGNAALGRALGRTGQTISNNLNHGKIPEVSTLLRLRTILGTSLDDILDGRADHAVDRWIPEQGIVLRSKAEQEVGDMATMLSMRELQKGHSRYAQLDVAVLYGEPDKRWSPLTIQLARDGQFEPQGCSSWTPSTWVTALDRLEGEVRKRLQVETDSSAQLPATPRPPSTSGGSVARKK